MDYYYSIGGEKHGPFKLGDLINQGLRPETLVWYQGLPNWMPAIQVAEIRPYLGSSQASATSFEEAAKAQETCSATPRSTFAPKTIRWIPTLLVSVFNEGFSYIPGFDESLSEGGWVWFVCIPMLVAYLVLICRLHYHCWIALPESLRATTPGRAVGFLFIPFFNLYWAFITWPKLSEGYVKWQQQENIVPVADTKILAFSLTALFVIGSIIMFFTEFPLIAALNKIHTLAGYIVFVLYYQQITTIANSMNSRSVQKPQSHSM